MLLLEIRNEFLHFMNRMTGVELFPAQIYAFHELPALIIPATSSSSAPAHSSSAASPDSHPRGAPAASNPSKPCVTNSPDLP
jgi:hypothetical protein